MNKKLNSLVRAVDNHIFSLIIIVFIAITFFIEYKNADVFDLSTDHWNSIPVAIKLDHPDLYKGDLYLDDSRDIKYYTPFYISILRISTKLMGGDYLDGLNLLNLILNIIFALAWYYFFNKLFRSRIFALTSCIIIGSIFWLPGYEVWGVGQLWISLPRTIFIALLPIAIHLIFHSNPFSNKSLAGYLFLGFISNFHPISGLGVFSGLFITDIIINRTFSFRHFPKVFFKLLLTLAGLLPFIYLYAKVVIQQTTSDVNLYNEFLSLRIGKSFTEPLLVFLEFMNLKWILFLGVPLILIILVKNKLTAYHKHMVNIFLIFSISIIFFSLIVIPCENVLKKIGVEMNMSFQLVRNLKYLILPAIIFYLILIYNYLGKFTSIHTYSYLVFFSIYFLALIFSKLKTFDKVPLLSDDLMRLRLPSIISAGSSSTQKDDQMLLAFDWINSNLPESAKFIGPSQIRLACKRSVIYDYKGASMLIEGNKDKFILWGQRRLVMGRINSLDSEIELYKDWGAEYIMTTKRTNNANSVYSNNRWAIYKLK